MGVAYIYCSYKDAEQQTPVNLIANLLQQLFLQCPYPIHEVAESYREHAKRQSRPLLNEFLDLLRSVIRTFSKVFIVIDALDECPEGDEIRLTFINAIKKLVSRSDVLVTSRSIPAIEHELGGVDRLEIKASEGDIKEYLEKRLLGSPAMRSLLKKDPELQRTILSRIAQKAKGMFLIARLYFDSLMTKITLRKVRSALDTLPEDLFDTYQETIRRIKSQNEDHANLAIKVLCWIFYAPRPLTVQEIQCALAIEPEDTFLDEDGMPDQDLLISVCAGMVAINYESNVIGLVHYTAQEFLEKEQKRVFAGAHCEIAHCCLTYLLFDSFRNVGTETDRVTVAIDQNPFLHYAAESWGIHAYACSDQQTTSLAVAFLQEQTRINLAVAVMCLMRKRLKAKTQTLAKDMSGLLLAAFFGLPDITLALIQTGVDLHLKDAEGQTALHHASKNGHQAAVIALIDEGLDVSAKDNLGWTALHNAASVGRTDLVEILISRGAAIDVTDDSRGTPLLRAAESGKHAVVRRLLEHGADGNLPSYLNQSPLHLAAANGHIEAVRVLLEYHVDRGAKDLLGWTPWYRAADNGHDEIAHLCRN